MKVSEHFSTVFQRLSKISEEGPIICFYHTERDYVAKAMAVLRLVKGACELTFFYRFLKIVEDFRGGADNMFLSYRKRLCS